jgi:hypothetical protein
MSELSPTEMWGLEQVKAGNGANPYREFRQQIHDDLRIQHPEWIQPNGECQMCDSYESRLMEQLDTFTGTGFDESVADIHRVLETGTNLIRPSSCVIAPPHERSEAVVSCSCAGCRTYWQSL